ncbi:MAG: DUF3187 family protein [SAR324 cluster bacterium]|nr:DUF3187 family protein [SAR324 cluster bacterium]
MKKIILTLLWLLLPSLAFARGNESLNRPFLVGPQYPLLFMSTTFEPDTAFPVENGKIYSQISFTNLNTYVFTDNSDKVDNPTGDASQFSESDSSGYSIYIDGEIDRRYFRIYWGWSDSVEIQLTYRDIRFVKGNLDSTIEGFHSTFGIGNQGREQTDQDLLEIYVHDNETGENVLVITQPNDSFHQESMTLGLKFNLRKTSTEAISLIFSSNFGDRYIEREINEVNPDYGSEYKKFNDFNYGLLYSSLFPDWTLHAGFSVAKVGESLLPKSPEEQYYFFLGASWELGSSTDLLIQVLEYSSPFPENNSSAIGSDAREITTGLRWFLADSATWEMGFTENQSQGPQNVDIVFFSNLGWVF